MECAESCVIVVRGHVQGVGYRYFTEDIAARLGIKGYSKNLPDGSVYLEVEGEKEAIEKFVELLWKGPRLARVADIEVDWRGFQGIFTDFSIRY